jgi:hypothetical protein
MKTKVYPTRETSLVLRHPIDGPLMAEGSDWELDGFTCRMLVDHALTSNPEEAWKPFAAAPIEPAPAPVAEPEAAPEPAEKPAPVAQTKSK